MENLIRMDDLGVPLFFGNIHVANFSQKEPFFENEGDMTLDQARGIVVFTPDSLPRNLSSSLFEKVSLKSLRFIREEGLRSEVAEQPVSAKKLSLYLLVFGIGRLHHIFAIDFDICDDVTPSINVIDVKVVILRFVDSFKSCFLIRWYKVDILRAYQQTSKLDSFSSDNP